MWLRVTNSGLLSDSCFALQKECRCGLREFYLGEIAIKAPGLLAKPPKGPIPERD